MILCLTEAIVAVVAEVAHVYGEAEIIAKIGYLRLTGSCGGLVSTILDVVLSKRDQDLTIMLMQNSMTLLPFVL